MLKILAIALVIVVALIAVRWQGGQYQRFVEKAQKISGHIVRKQERMPFPDQRSRKEHWVTYRYSVDGKEYQGEEKVEYTDLWLDLAEGQAVEVYYTRQNPSQSHLAPVLDRRLAIVP